MSEILKLDQNFDPLKIVIPELTEADKQALTEKTKDWKDPQKNLAIAKAFDVNIRAYYEGSGNDSERSSELYIKWNKDKKQAEEELAELNIQHVIQSLLTKAKMYIKNMPPGHGPGHFMGEAVGLYQVLLDDDYKAIKLQGDHEINSEEEKVDKIDRFITAIGTFMHDIGNALVDRYADGKSAAAHAEVGAKLFEDLNNEGGKKLIPNTLERMIMYAIGSHTHYTFRNGSAEIKVFDTDGDQITSYTRFQYPSEYIPTTIKMLRAVDRTEMVGAIGIARNMWLHPFPSQNLVDGNDFTELGFKGEYEDNFDKSESQLNPGAIQMINSVLQNEFDFQFSPGLVSKKIVVETEQNINGVINKKIEEKITGRNILEHVNVFQDNYQKDNPYTKGDTNTYKEYTYIGKAFINSALQIFQEIESSNDTQDLLLNEIDKIIASYIEFTQYMDPSSKCEVYLNRFKQRFAHLDRASAACYLGFIKALIKPQGLFHTQLLVRQDWIQKTKEKFGDGTNDETILAVAEIAKSYNDYFLAYFK